MKQKLKKIAYITFVIWLAMFIRKLVIHRVVLNTVNGILGASFGSNFIAVVLSAAVTSLMISFMMYLLYREDAEERRAFLKYFAENEFTEENDRKYILNLKSMHEGLITFAVALLIYVVFEFGLLLVISFLYIIDIMLIFGIVFGVEFVFEIAARKKLHEKWESERLHK